MFFFRKQKTVAPFKLSSKDFTKSILTILREVDLTLPDTHLILDTIGKKMGIVIHCTPVNNIFKDSLSPSKKWN